MDRRQSIADFVLPRTARPAAPTVPSFDELWPDLAAPATGHVVAVDTPAAPVAKVPEPVVAEVPEPVVVEVVPQPVVVEVPEPVVPGFESAEPVAGYARPARSDVRPVGGTVTTLPLPRTTATVDELDTAAGHGPTSFPGAAVDPRRTRPAHPRDARIVGVRHEARHQAARTDPGGLHDMMKQLLEARGSDLHLTCEAPPTIRVHGVLRRLPDHGPMAATEIETLMRSIVDGEQWDTFSRHSELDFAYTAPSIGRFRVNIYRQRGACGAAFRAIPTDIPALGSLGLPPQVEAFAHLPRGLVLVTGPTGSGKTTTLASLLALANQVRSPHIVTIEDPIEFVHQHGTGLVNQREVGSDTESFAAALKHALRQDPDVILVGELRDLETTATALTAAETGHLVFATLHTQSAAQTIDRVIDIFPPHQQQEIRSQLSTTLRGVVTQALAPRADGTGRAVVAEIMVATPAIRNLIREGKTHQIPSFMQAGGRDGMVSFDQHLAELVRGGVIAYDRALSVCHSTEEFARLAQQGVRA